MPGRERGRAVRCEGVGKRYRGHGWVLRDVDLQLEPGEVVELTGGNGSGKSTLLRILAEIVRADAGTIRGRPHRIGYVPDRLTVHGRVPAIAYLEHMGRLRGLSSAHARERGHLLLDRLSFQGGENAPMSTLSKGNAQKVGIAQAALERPGLLILDEPYAGLDAAALPALSMIVSEMAADGTAVIFAHHRLGGLGEPHRAYRLTVGRIVEVVSRPGGARSRGVLITLVVPPGTAPQELDWTQVPGVYGAHHLPGAVALTTSPTASDQVIARALGAGYSIRAVRPSGPESADQGTRCDRGGSTCDP